MKFIFVYVTCPSLKIAKHISEKLVLQGLIACSNISKIDSVYRWNDKLVSDKEYVMIAKTSAKKYPLVKNNILKIHPYKIPCIIAIPIQPNKEYSDWMLTQLK